MTLKTPPLVSSPNPHGEPNQPRKWFLILVGLGVMAVFLLFNSDFLEMDDQGNPVLAPFRKAKLEKELEELDHAEQYALIAARDQDYPCFNCPGKSTIFLRKGMIFKYGATRKGEVERYGTWHIDNNLLYVIQFEGTWQECLRQEKLKIYYYAELPENLSRAVPLIRPPGNRRDY